MLKKIILDKINSALLPGPSLARQTSCPRTVIINICYLINNTAFYRDFAIAQQKIHVLTEKSNRDLKFGYNIFAN